MTPHCFQPLDNSSGCQRFDFLEEAGDVAVAGPKHQVEVVGQEDICKELKGEACFDLRHGGKEFPAKLSGAEEGNLFVGGNSDKVEWAQGCRVGPLFHAGLDCRPRAGAKHPFRTGVV